MLEKGGAFVEWSKLLVSRAFLGQGFSENCPGAFQFVHHLGAHGALSSGKTWLPQGNSYNLQDGVSKIVVISPTGLNAA